MSGGVAYRHKRKKPMGEINVVPYIDVMLVLLVIFMITAPLLTQGVKVELPQAAAETVPPAAIPPLVVTVDAQGDLHYTKGSERPLRLDAESMAVRVAAELRINPKTPVYVRGDRNVAYGKVVAVMAMLQQAGVTGVGLLTETPE
ncbi:MAG: protein TolR [Gammaproteobacteria bacterium HGW-Gammaproteobacteria-1]|jgi:biopolymer transport protein TolR|nr:MAG: protein TolR [Gammaproteobacteria bacterium HGW-Gammaproteobacteria-1]